MPLNLFLSAAESPRNAAVVSQLNPVPIRLRDLIHKDRIPANIYVVDGSGSYDPRSGASGYSLQTSIGNSGQAPIWLSSPWAAVSNGWSGSINTDASGFATQFTATEMNPMPLILEAKLFNPQGFPSTVAQLPFKLYDDQIGGGTPTPDALVNSTRGSFQLTAGQDSYTVTGLGLLATPLQVLPHPIRKPANGLNIFATIVNGTLTTDGFSFTLDAQPDSAGYWLDYLIAFS